MSEQIYQLIVRRGPKQGHVYELHLPIVNVGRDPMSDINLNDPEVSRQHARLIRTGDSYQLQDLNSTNGTYLNGKKVENEAIHLQSGQEVMMGSGVVLLYHVAVEEEAAPPTPEPSPLLSEENDPEPPESDRPETIASDFKFSRTADPAPAKTPPLPDLRSQNPPKPPPPVTPQVVMAESDNGRRNQTLAIAIILILLCGCCAFLIFMYQWGGDWILQQLGLIS